MSDEERREPLDIPDRRKNTYEELQKCLDDHIDHIETQFQKWFVRGLVAFSIIALTSAVALAGFGINLRSIQNTRKEFVRTTCQNTNDRHDDTYRRLIALSQVDQNNAKTEAAKKEIRRRRDVTLGLIDALSPKQDCAYLVKIAVGEIDPSKTVKEK